MLATYAVTQAALQRARDGQGPTLVEAYTYRMGAHTTTDDPTRYRLSDDVEHWKLKDPIARVEVYLCRNGLADDEFFAPLKRGRRPRPPPARGLQGAPRPEAAEHVRPRLRRGDRGAARAARGLCGVPRDLRGGPGMSDTATPATQRITLAKGLSMWPAATTGMVAPWPGEVVDRGDDSVTLRGGDYELTLDGVMSVPPLGARLRAGDPLAEAAAGRWTK